MKGTKDRTQGATWKWVLICSATLFGICYVAILVLLIRTRAPLVDLFRLWLGFSATTMNGVIEDLSRNGMLAQLRAVYVLNIPSVTGFAVAATALCAIYSRRRTGAARRWPLLAVVAVILVCAIDIATSVVVMSALGDGRQVAEWTALMVSSSYAFRFAVLTLLVLWVVARIVLRHRAGRR